MHRKFTGSQIIYRNCVAYIYNLFYFSLGNLLFIFLLCKNLDNSIPLAQNYPLWGLRLGVKDYNLLKILSRVSIHSILIER